MNPDYTYRPVVDAATLDHLDSAGRVAVYRTQDVVDGLRREVDRLEQEAGRMRRTNDQLRKDLRTIGDIISDSLR